MLIELHSLTSHPPANLNRDDLGRPKEATFGGVRRARISSQSLKRSVRRSPYLGMTLGLRSERHPEEFRDRLVRDGVAREQAESVVNTFLPVLGKADDKTPFNTSQATFLTPAEQERIYAHLLAVTQGEKEMPAAPKGEKAADRVKRLRAMAETVGLHKRPDDAPDLALFGRMTTDDAGAFVAVEAAMQVAHPISTHEVTPETDWFSAVDEITQARRERGAGHINEAEFNAAVFYKYFSCNLELLVQNLGGKPDAALDALAAFLDAACRVTPTGKQNTFASHALADTVLLVLREARIPCSLANAFERPVEANGGGYLTESRKRLVEHYRHLVGAYGFKDHAALFSVQAEVRGALLRLTTDGDAPPAPTEAALTLADLFGPDGFLKRHAAEAARQAATPPSPDPS